MDEAPAASGLRLDKWLWFARLTRTRSEAQALCESRRLRLDGRVVDRPAMRVKPGQVLAFARADRVVAVRVEALVERRRGAAEARELYTELLPEPA